ncbi:MAG: hypothetical protein LIQ31_07620 [Planctomycetes bacterium]|nr:hypothetical protein [Planctomycetota bacterium]
MNVRSLTFALLLFGLAFFQSVAISAEPALGNITMNEGSESRIRLSFDGREAVVKVYDHPTTRALLAQLPLTLTFKDFAGKEKIGYLAERLPTDGGSAITSGDFAYYAPWGNVAIFYSGSGRADGSLIILGTMESGKSELAAMRSDFTMTLERIH